MRVYPSYRGGYAKNIEDAKYPILCEGLIGAWDPGLGVTGLVLRDQCGRQNHGTLTSMDAADWVLTEKGWVLDFDGSTNDHVLAGDVSAEMRGGYTISTWMYRRAGSRRVMLNQWGAGGAGNASWLFESTGTLRWGNYNGSTSSLLTTSGSLAVNTWQHVAATWDGTTTGTNSRAYFDGVEVASGTITVVLQTSTLYGLYIGREAAGGDLWDGMLRDMRIYNRPLSGREIQLLARRPGIAYERRDVDIHFAEAQAAAANNRVISFM